MQKLFLLKCDSKDKENVDVFVVLNTVTDISCYKEGDRFKVHMGQVDGMVAVTLDTEIEARALLKEIINALGGDPSFADDYRIAVRPRRQEEFSKLLDKLKDGLKE